MITSSANMSDASREKGEWIEWCWQAKMNVSCLSCSSDSLLFVYEDEARERETLLIYFLCELNVCLRRLGLLFYFNVTHYDQGHTNTIEFALLFPSGFVARSYPIAHDDDADEDSSGRG